jgi:diacylglycerol kinase family enzyme
VKRALGDYNLAVVLNDNAKRVTPQVRATIHDLVPERNIFYSRSLEDSSAIARKVVEAGYDAVFTGGGDGTVIQFINDLVATKAPLPTLGVLPLGTGNAIASMVSSGDYLHDLETYVLHKQADFQHIGLLEAEGRVFPFAGLGIDARILNDYVHIKKRYAENRVMKPLLQGLGGYLLASFGRTIPHTIADALSGRKTNVRVTNLSGLAFRADVDGTPVEEFGPGQVIYEGEAHMVSAATAPYYGHGLKIFPNSLRHPGYFEMRVIFGSIARAVVKLGTVWKGRFIEDGFWSVMASHAAVEFDREMPFQIGGDALGYRRDVVFQLSPTRLRLLRFI